MKIKRMTPAFLLGISFLVFSSMPFVLAEKDLEVGDNCEESIMQTIAEIPKDVTWDNVMQFVDEEGRLWTRGTLSEPRDTLKVREIGNSRISGLAQAGADVRLFIFLADEENGILQKPGDGTCFVAKPADESNNFSFSINSTILWDSIGKEMVVDPFYLDPNPIPKDQNNQNFHIGTHTPASILNLVGDIGSGESCERKITCEGKTEGSYTNTESEQVITLSPSSIDERFIGNTFDPVGNNDVTIIRHAGPHTFYAGAEGGGSINESDVRDISLITFSAESIKRLLLSQENTNEYMGSESSAGNLGINIGNPGIENFEQVSLEEPFSEDSPNTLNRDIYSLLESIKNMLQGNDRRENAESIVDTLNTAYETINEWDNSNIYPLYEITTDHIDQLFPESEDEEAWASDIQEIMSFWTGSIEENHCLMKNDRVEDWNFTSREDFNNSPVTCDDQTFYAANGISPSLLLHSEEDILLSPDFPYALRIVIADKKFTNDSSWFFSAKEVKKLYYEYEFSQDTNPNSIGELCLSRADISQFSEELGNTFALLPQERKLIEEELEKNLPSSRGMRYSIVHPQEVAQYFKWNVNERPADIFQIFLKSKFTECEDYSLKFSEGSISLPEESRDGFEVGFWE